MWSFHLGQRRTRGLAAAVLVVAVVGAPASCADEVSDAGGSSDQSDPAPGGSRPPTLGTEAAGVVEGATARVFDRLGPDGGVPLSDGDFADPFVLETSRLPIGFASNTTTQNVPVSRPGLRGEVEIGDALPEVGSWSEPGLVWAPGVLEIDSDRSVLYYTSLHRASGRQCIGAAVADDPRGPYVDRSEEPLICQLDLGGSIDASPIVVEGEPWLVWKSDGNCCELSTTIWSQRLGDDGTSLSGEPTALVANDQEWEGPLVEGPAMVSVDGRLHLFYSANLWDTDRYAIGHAVCETMTGPCVKDAEPFLTSGEEFSGPGGQELFTDRAGQLWMTFHGWLPGEVGYSAGGTRRLFVEKIEVGDDGSLRLARTD